ncbi:MAG: dihydrofolate reductase family protein [Ignavibacteriales bacterium]
MMRKLIVSMHISLNGLVSGPNGEMDWLIPGVEESQPDMEKFFLSVDTMIMGRVTYEGLSQYWPPLTDRFSDWINNIPKIVISRAPIKVKWGKWDSIRLIHESVTDEIKKLKQEEGRNMVIVGGANLVQSFTNLGLIDEYRLVVDHVILPGRNMFMENIEKQHNLELIDMKRYEKGTIVLHYRMKND